MFSARPILFTPKIFSPQSGSFCSHVKALTFATHGKFTRWRTFYVQMDWGHLSSHNPLRWIRLRSQLLKWGVTHRQRNARNCAEDRERESEQTEELETRVKSIAFRFQTPTIFTDSLLNFHSVLVIIFHTKFIQKRFCQAANFEIDKIKSCQANEFYKRCKFKPVTATELEERKKSIGLTSNHKTMWRDNTRKEERLLKSDGTVQKNLATYCEG